MISYEKNDEVPGYIGSGERTETFSSHETHEPYANQSIDHNASSTIPWVKHQKIIQSYYIKVINNSHKNKVRFSVISIFEQS
jgi:hypothetical protein